MTEKVKLQKLINMSKNEHENEITLAQTTIIMTNLSDINTDELVRSQITDIPYIRHQITNQESISKM